MKHTDIKLHQTEIRIYQSLWKNMLYAICCFAFAVGGYIIVTTDHIEWITKMVGGWLGMIFFVGGGLLLTIMTLYNRIHRIPFIIIYEDKIELYEQGKGSYYSILFKDVRAFRLFSLDSSLMIAIDYKNTPLKQKIEESSTLKKKLMTYNFIKTGAIESIPVHNLKMRGKDVCHILNLWLERFNQHNKE